MRAKFRTGDVVLTNWKTKVRIIRSYGQFGEIFYEAEDPYSKSSTTYKESELTFDHSHIPKSQKDFTPDVDDCPKCGNPWSITGMGRRKWYDCLKCKDSAENLCKKESKNDKYSNFIVDWGDDD